MNYTETLEYLLSQLPMFQRIGQSAYKANLDTTLALDQYFRHPHKLYPTIHVAGTNGKGSVSHSIAAVLQQAGYKTGLYTSPHLLDFRERIRINGQMIPEEDVIWWVEKYKGLFKKLSPSFFEMTAAMAFDYFAMQKIDVAVIEVGMGGRLDSTNIITPKLSIITNIGLDHTQFLGNSLVKIAEEKAGIIKQYIPVVIGEYNIETLPVFQQKATGKHAELILAPQLFEVQNSEVVDCGLRYFSIKSLKHNNLIKLKFDLTGNYQQKNIVTILAAIEVLKKQFVISDNHIAYALPQVTTKTGLKGRWQILQQSPLIVADIAHNAAGIEQVTNFIKEIQHQKLHIVFGAVNDKDINSILKFMPQNAHYYITAPSVPRALPEEQLYKIFTTAGFCGNKYKTVENAINAAITKAAENDMIYIGGSAFVVADALQYWENKNRQN